MMKITDKQYKNLPVNLRECFFPIIHKEKPIYASRFFYCAKASKAERDMGLENMEAKQKDPNRNENLDTIQSRLHGSLKRHNNHPTVKPLALMKYLIKLITPPNGIVLDMFAGSGSTLIAAKQLGFPYIGIEIDENYCEIAEKRINAVQDKLFY